MGRKSAKKANTDRRGRREKNHMVKNIDEFQQLGKDNMDASMKAFGALSKSA